MMTAGPKEGVMRVATCLILALLLAACGSQRRDTYTDRHDPWADYTPAPRDTYDRTYVPPHQRTADERYEDARQFEGEGRDDQARVEYHGVFLRDRWHHPGNEAYQDLMLRNGLETNVWQEYLDLWDANRGRGDALWLHLRPLLIQRGDFVPQERRRRAPTAEQQEQVDELLLRVERHEEAGEAAEAYRLVVQALEIADLPELHRLRIALADESEVGALIARYAETFDDDPSDGDMLAMFALATARSDTVEALRLLRDGYVLDLPGYWLPFALGELCWAQAVALEDEAGDDISDDELLQLRGWLLVAEAMWEACTRARPDDELARTGLEQVREWLED